LQKGIGGLIFSPEACAGPGGGESRLTLLKGVKVMKHTIAELKAKIHEMYPDIDEYGVTSSITYDKEKKTFVLELKKDVHHLATYIDKVDADKCLDNIECVHLGVQIGQFMENFKKV
jgi:hypothetical protein